MIPLHGSFSQVCPQEGAEVATIRETGQSSKSRKSKIWKPMFHGVKSLFQGQRSTAAAAYLQPGATWPKSAGGEADDLVLGTVFQTFRVLLNAPDAELAQFFIDNLIVSGLFQAKVSSKRETYRENVEEFVRSRIHDMDAQIASELLTIVGSTQSGRHSTPNGFARGAPSLETAELPTMQHEINSFACLPIGFTESACTDGEQVLEDRSREKPTTGISLPLASSAASKNSCTGAPRDTVTQNAPRTTVDSCTSASSSKLMSLEVPRDVAQRNSHKHQRRTHATTQRRSHDSSEQRGHDWPERRSHKQNRGCRATSQPAQGQQGVWSRQNSAEEHPNFDRFLAAEVQQYHLDRVLRLRRSA